MLSDVEPVTVLYSSSALHCIMHCTVHCTMNCTALDAFTRWWHVLTESALSTPMETKVTKVENEISIAHDSFICL